MWSTLGLSGQAMADLVTLTPACGMAGASAGWVTTALRLLRQAARVLGEDPVPA